MLGRIDMGIWLWLLGLAALVSAPLFVFSLYTLYELRRNDREADLKQLSQRSQASASAIAQHLNASLGLLNTLATSNVAKRCDLQNLYEHAKRAVRISNNASAISLVDRQDRLMFLTLRPFSHSPEPANDLASVREVFRTGKPAISAPFPSPVNKDRLVMAIGVPMFVNEELVYCLRLIIPVAMLNQMLQEQQLPDEWISAVLTD